MIFKHCLNCFKIVSYALHVFAGAKCCTANAESPTLKQMHHIELSLDQLVDPCEDFYGYACNNWAEQHPYPKYDEITGFVDYQTNIQLMNIIESGYQYPLPANQSGCQNFVEKTRAYYKSCVNEEGRNVSRYFESIKPGPGLEWPLMEELRAYQRGDKNYAVNEWPTHHFDIFALLGQLQSYGLNNVLISLEMARTQNGSLQIILELPSVAENDAIPIPLLMVLLMGWGLPEDTAQKYARKIMKTDEYWLTQYQNYSESYDTAPLKLTYSELRQTYPQLSTFLENTIPQQIQDGDFIALLNRDYLEFLMNRNWGPKAQNISNYLMLKFLIHLIQDTTSDFTKLDCIKDLRNKMDLSVNYLYYEHIYKPQAANNCEVISLLTKEIFQYYLETIQENPLDLNPAQLQQMVDKLSTLRINLGNLPQDFHVSQVEEFYEDVPALDRRNYYTNHLHLLRHRFLKSLVYPQNQSFFIATDNKVGSSSAPIYIPKQHMIILPMGFLQQPIYDYDFDPIFLWSMLGFLLAHEYTHAIDTTGLQYGNDGLLLSSDSGILEQDNFSDSLNCLLQQEPTEALDERLADVVGARVAYKAYVRKYHWQPQPTFSNIPWKKLFFLNLSQFFCGRKDVQFVDHDTDAVRLQQIVMNLEGFSEAFQCPLGSKMNPEKKCRVY